MTSVINAAHANGARVVLTVQSFAWSSSGVTRQKALLGSSTARANLARQIAAAVRDRGADGVNLDFEPIASGYADEFTALVRTVRAELNKIAAGLPADVRHDRLDRQLPDRGRDRVRRRRRGRDHGLRLPDVGSSARSDRSRRSAAPATTSATRSRAYVARVPASKVILGVPYYGRAWSTARRPARQEHLGHQVRGVDDRRLRHGPRVRVDHGTQ